MFNRTLIAALLIASGATLAFGHDDNDGDGSRTIDQTRPLKADGALFVGNVAGKIEVQAWDKSEVHITGELGDGAQKLEISGDNASLHVEVKAPKNAHDIEDSVLRLQVPAGVSVEIEAVSADLTVHGVRGAVHAQSVSGDVELSVGSADVEAQSVSGSVTLRAPSRNTRINTVSGDVHVSGARERLRLETVSGDVDIQGEAIADMELKSVSGDLNADVGLAAVPKISAESLSGEIRLELPKEPDAVLTLHSFSGDLETAFGAAVPEGRKRYEATLGSGKGRIDLNSFSGDIRLGRGKR